MKKTLAVVLALLMAATMVFTLVSCGSAEDKVEEYVKEANKQIEPMKSQFTDLGMDLEYEARGTTIVLVMTISDYIEDALEGQYDALSSTYDSMITIDQVKKECPEVTSVVIEIRNESGRVLFSKEFK